MVGRQDRDQGQLFCEFSFDERRTQFDTMLIGVKDKRVMTQQAVAADFDQLACRNR